MTGARARCARAGGGAGARERAARCAARTSARSSCPTARTLRAGRGAHRNYLARRRARRAVASSPTARGPMRGAARRAIPSECTTPSSAQARVSPRRACSRTAPARVSRSYPRAHRRAPPLHHPPHLIHRAGARPARRLLIHLYALAGGAPLPVHIPRALDRVRLRATHACPPRAVRPRKNAQKNRALHARAGVRADGVHRARRAGRVKVRHAGAVCHGGRDRGRVGGVGTVRVGGAGDGVRCGVAETRAGCAAGGAGAAGGDGGCAGGPGRG